MALQKNKWFNQWDITEIVIAIRLRVANGFGVCLVHWTVCAFFAWADVHVELIQHWDETAALQLHGTPVWMAALVISFNSEVRLIFCYRLMHYLLFLYICISLYIYTSFQCNENKAGQHILEEHHIKCNKPVFCLNDNQLIINSSVYLKSLLCC